MKILVIFTGGTIGCVVKEGWLSTDSSSKYTLINTYQSPDDVIFETKAPYTVLSENLSAAEINMLQKEVISALEGDYDGIIVTHGTDTLQYTAAALEYSVCGCDIPVVLVSSDYPLEDERTNGHANFKAAVEFIRSKPAGGIFVSYKNDNREFADIHIASHIFHHSECSANIFSIDGFPYASYDGKKIINTGKTVAVNCNGLGFIPFTESSDILVIDSRPGDSFAYSLDGIKAVLIKPYHSATLNTASSALRSFCKRAKEKSIPVFVANVLPGINYESTKLFDEMGIIPLPFGTYISAYMKIWTAVSLGKDIVEFAKKPIANEIIK